ncbi:hypothetical protein N9N67_02095 [Bacteriovoracaceae bacterium]|nr:hypothetical protein [Bacteriovoracaceae bacterium]
MGILDRRKKQGAEGFKSYVQNLETSPQKTLKEILRISVLDDSIYTKWAVRNILTFTQVLNLDDDTVDLIVDKIPNSYTLFCKALHGRRELEESFTKKISRQHLSKYKDEKEYITSVKTPVQETVTFTIIKYVRKFQDEGQIQDLKWDMPPQSIIDYKRPDTVNGVFEFRHENGEVSARGPLAAYERTGDWQHFYVGGDLMAEGSYNRGKKEGLWTFFALDGSILARGEYKSDEKVGEWEVND